jgi:ABC-type transport system involved in cytochrome bd biosynthesis fused ATPase/permease subunit
MFIKKNENGNKTLTFLSSAVLSLLLVVSVVTVIVNVGVHFFDLEIKPKIFYEEEQ